MKSRAPTKPIAIQPEIENSAASANGSSEEEIRERAYGLYLAEGQPEGRDLEHWLAAEADCNAAMKNGEAPGSGEAEAAEIQEAKAGKQGKKPAAAKSRARKTAAA